MNRESSVGTGLADNLVTKRKVIYKTCPYPQSPLPTLTTHLSQFGRSAMTAIAQLSQATQAWLTAHGYQPDLNASGQNGDTALMKAVQERAIDVTSTVDILRLLRHATPR